MNEPYILVVDDDPDVREILELILTTLPVRTLYAQDGAEALMFVRVLAPLLIVLDLTMPRVDGKEVLRVLQSDPQHTNIPVIVFTAYRVDDQLIKEVCIPADRVLRKGSVSMTYLRKTIINLLDDQIDVMSLESY